MWIIILIETLKVLATFQPCLCVLGLTKEKEQRGSRRRKQKTKERAERKQLEAIPAARKNRFQKEKQGELQPAGHGLV